MKWASWLVGALLLIAAALGMGFWYQSSSVSREAAKAENLWHRRLLTQDLTLALEKYRRTAAGFRKLTDAEIVGVKNGLREEIRKGVERLEKLEPTEEEKSLGETLNKQVADFMTLSAKLEPWLFTKDVYQKPEAKEAHEAMVKTLMRLRASALERQTGIHDEFQSKRAWLGRAFALGLAGWAALLGFLLLGLRLTHVAPLRKLLGRAREVTEGKFKREQTSRLKGDHLEIEKAMDELARAVDSQRLERQQFVTAVATDLRVPLVPLQASACLLASNADAMSAEQRMDTAEIVKSSATRLSRTLEDLGDIVDLEQGKIRLDERIADLRDLVGRSASLLEANGTSHRIRATLPALPVWTFVDTERLERVLINLISKMMQYSPQGGILDVSLTRNNRPGQGGVEVVIQEGSGDGPSALRVTGPEQELLKHWISENGFGLTLAQRIVEAHGGRITAAGLAGTSVQITLRLPEERVSGGVLHRARGGFPTISSGEETKAQSLTSSSRKSLRVERTGSVDA